MSDTRSWWQRLIDGLPWNREATRERERAELEAALDELAPADDAPPAASAAEAMAEMKARSRAKRPARASSDAPSEEAPENTDLRARWRASERSGPSEADKDDLKRNRGA